MPNITAWPPSPKALLLNPSYPTTGTRFVDCVMRKLGLLTMHNNGPATPLKYYCNGLAPPVRNVYPATMSTVGDNSSLSCTRAWDTFDYVSDNPTPDQARGWHTSCNKYMQNVSAPCQAPCARATRLPLSWLCALCACVVRAWEPRRLWTPTYGLYKCSPQVYCLYLLGWTRRR